MPPKNIFRKYLCDIKNSNQLHNVFIDIQTAIAGAKDRLSALAAICAALTIISLEMER